jgi:hypothetical protein
LKGFFTMADDPKKSLEMRVAELEDKLSKIHITEDEMKAFHKVSSLLGTGAAAQAAPPGAAHGGCIADCVQGCWTECRGCTIRNCTIRQCCIIFRQCTFECGGGCAPGGGGFTGGGFGTLGT